MGYFFLDIETFIDDEVKYSALNPFTPKSKVLAIAFNYYNEFKINEKIIRKPTIFKEWEVGEKKNFRRFLYFCKIKITRR